ncbi:MAG: tol-pal system-associated acyl-CoA thioesterase [Proteobacteria bacterium]|jgi:acyl-CoA thioester hydrolase|nr:tol-pal system-associated acyl-CoA thioesterase [Pseudomonadota bacterium]
MHARFTAAPPVATAPPVPAVPAAPTAPVKAAAAAAPVKAAAAAAPAAPDGRSVFRHPVRVYWEDTDAGGIVYYANYLKFFERARTEWLRALGIGQQALREADGAMFVVVHTRVAYRTPARLDDRLDITVALRHAGRVALTIVQQAWREQTLLAEGEIRIGCVDAGTLRPCRIPTHVLDALA